MRKPMHANPHECSSFVADVHAVVQELLSSNALSEQSLPRVIESIQRFCSFCVRAFDLESLSAVSTTEAAGFIRAPSRGGEPALATMHMRRSVLRLLFRTARGLELADHDPTIDLELPPRSPMRARPLSDEEVALCRAASMHSLTATRLTAAWGLAEATARSSELGHIRSRDLDLDGCRVWLHGSSRTEARWVPLSEWGTTQLERRLRAIGDDPERLVVYEGEQGSDYHRQAASCMAITKTLRRSGVAGESDVGPLSVVGWAGRQVLAETGRIDEVAVRLGVRSLDRAAALIGWDWTTDGIDDG